MKLLVNLCATPLAVFFALLTACPAPEPSLDAGPDVDVDGGSSSGNDGGEPAPDADGGTPSDASVEVDAGADVDAGQSEIDGGPTLDAGAPSDAGIPSAICPAPTLASDETEIFGDTNLAGWESYGFNSGLTVDTEIVCSGTNSLQYTSQQYDGFLFITEGIAPAAGRLSVRVYLDAPSRWTIAAVRPGEEDPHQFIGEDDWQAGWQTIEYDIPETTPTTTWILFEKQSEGSATIHIDDLRLHAR